MKIAIVGGGNGCLELMSLIERYRFKEITPEIIAVADTNNDAPGLVTARGKGLIITNDYNDFFSNPDIELIIELTNSMDVYNDILSKKKQRCQGHGAYHRHAVLGNRPCGQPA